MTTPPPWLPPIVPVGGDWDKVVEKLYEIFNEDFVRKGCAFEGRPVWWDRRIEKGGKYEEGFWKIITRFDYNTNERLFDPRRAERLTWCAPIINNSKDSVVKTWDYRETNRRIRTYLWLEDWDYVVIIEKRMVGNKEVVFLVSAFHIDGESKRRNLRMKFSRRVN